MLKRGFYNCAEPVQVRSIAKCLDTMRRCQGEASGVEQLAILKQGHSLNTYASRIGSILTNQRYELLPTFLILNAVEQLTPLTVVHVDVVPISSQPRGDRN